MTTTTSGPGHTTTTQPGHAAQPSTPPTWGTEFPESSGGGLNKPVVVIAMLGLGLALFGVIRSFVGGEPKQAAAATPPVVTYMSEQRQMMHEAMQMAREAREAQREHMEMMRRAMEESEGGMPGGE